MKYSPASAGNHRARVLALSMLMLLGLLPSFASALTPPTVVKVGESVSGNTGQLRNFMIHWTDNSDDENLFQIRVRIGPTGAFVPISATLGNNDYTTWTPADSQLAGIPNGTKFYFTVLACKATLTFNSSGGVTGYSSINEFSGVPDAVELTYYTSASDASLDAPTGLNVTIPTFTRNSQTLSDEGKIRITFTDNSDREDGYQFFIKKSTDALFSATADAQTLPLNLNDYTFSNAAFLYNSSTGTSGLEPGTTYNMKIRAYAGLSAIQANSVDSNIVTFTIPSLHEPTGFTMTAVDETKITCNWLDNSNGEHGYVLQWKETSGLSYAVATGTAANVTTFDITAANFPGLLLPGYNLKWRVAAAYNPASNTTGNSANYLLAPSANEITISTLFNAPLNLQATTTTDPLTNAATVTLTWEDKSARETGYRVLAQINGTGGYSTVADLAANAQTTTVTLANPGASYEFKVVGFYDENGSILSTTADSNILTVVMKDGFTSRLYEPATVGTAFSYQAVTSHPANRTSWSVAGLPDGLIFDSNTGLISGTPTEGGLFPCPMTATFSNGWTAGATLTLRVIHPNAAPTRPSVITTRSMAPGGIATLPLTDLFADRDTEQVLRMTTNKGDIDIVLYPTLTPQTVTNFLAYVNAGDYTGSIFHRNSPGFVLQGGGYKAEGSAPTNFDEINRRASPLNEPGISNTRGTISLAKGSDPNSGTHDFFVNLGDNSSLLDSSTGGFTVFGRVAGFQPSVTTTPTIESILALPGRIDYSINLKPSGSTTRSALTPLSTNLGSGTIWPIDDTSAPSTIDNTKMVTIGTFTSLPILTHVITSVPDGNFANAEISGGNLVINGVAEGTTTLQITATDVDGNTTTQDMTITVLSGYLPPSIAEHPVSMAANPGTTAAFTVNATGTGLTYQWRKNGKNIGGQVSATLTLNAVSATDGATYTVVVSNEQGSVTSNGAILTVNSPPDVTSPIATTAVSRNFHTSATMTVTATGAGTLGYQWKKGSTVLSNGTHITGADSASLTLSNLELADAGTYSCVVSSAFPPSDTSPDFVLTVNQIDTDGDGLKDDEELARVPPTSINDADSDDDGYSDGLEVSLGTDPKVASINPGSTRSVASHDGAAAIAGIGLKRITGLPTATFVNRIASGAFVSVPDQWLATNELTNEQFAAVLDHAVRVMDVAEVVDVSGRSAVRYPKTTGQIICYMAATPSTNSSDPSCDIDYDARTKTFHHLKTLNRMPVRGVSWYGAYLATVALNNKFGYSQINTANFTFSSNVAHLGYLIPSYVGWEWAARGGANPGFTYPTGATISSSLAKYNDSTATAKPKTVASYAASKLGLYDLAGNVAEWIFDEDTGTAGNGYTRGGAFADVITAFANPLANTGHSSLPKATISNTIGIRLAMRESATPAISPALKDQLVKVGETITITATATGAPNLLYQWYKNGIAMAGKTSATLSIPNATTADAAAYMVKVTSNGASVTSTTRVAVIQIEAPAPTYYIVPNKTLTMTPKVTLAPGQTLNYSWFRDGFAAGTTYFKGGDHLKTLTMHQALSGLAAIYSCVVSVPGSSPSDSETPTFNVIVYNQPIPVVPTNLNWAAVGGEFSQSLTYTLSVSGQTDNGRIPTKWIITGLPAGLTYDPLTGRIYGRPKSSGGPFAIKVKASNPFTTSSEFSTTINIASHPLSTFGSSTYRALVDRHSISTGGSTGVNDGLGGRLDLTATNGGYATGKLTIGGASHSLMFYLEPQFTAPSGNTTGTLQNVLVGNTIIPRTGKLSLKLSVIVTISAITNTEHTVTGSVGEIPAGAVNPNSTAFINGWRNKFTVSQFPTSSISRSGLHNFAINPPSGSADPVTVPQGTSYGSATVDLSGVTTVAGKLADDVKGTAYTTSSYLSPTGQVMIFQSLYGNKGSVLGKVLISNDPKHTTTIDGSLTWQKKDQGTTSTSRSYKAGFPFTLNLEMLGGGVYTTQAGAMMGLDAPSGTPATNGVIDFTSGGLSPTFSQLIAISSTNVPTVPTPNDKVVTLALDKTKGQFSGTYTLVDDDPTSSVVGKNVTRLAYYYGIVVPHPTISGKGIGYGFFNLAKLPDTTHIASKTDIQSGKVVLNKKP